MIEHVAHATTDAYGIYDHLNGTVNADICSANLIDDIAGPDCFVHPDATLVD